MLHGMLTDESGDHLSPTGSKPRHLDGCDRMVVGFLIPRALLVKADREGDVPSPSRALPQLFVLCDRLKVSGTDRSQAGEPAQGTRRRGRRGFRKGPSFPDRRCANGP